MRSVKIKFQNCYGIKSFDETLSFEVDRSVQNRAIAIYAPNGSMKTSFTRSFEDLSDGKSPQEERFGRNSLCTVAVDGIPIDSKVIYVLRSDIDISKETTAFTNVLVDPAKKTRYDELVVDIEKAKSKLIVSLNKKSKVKKEAIESTIIKDSGKPNFFEAIQHLSSVQTKLSTQKIDYQTIFDPKALEVLNSPDFLSNANEFNDRYNELFDQTGSIYKKGVFNPVKADNSFKTLDKQGFFKIGHRVHLAGETVSVDKEMLDEKMSKLNKLINEDKKLKSIQDKLSKNAQTQALIDLFETLSPVEVEELIEWSVPEKRSELKKELWRLFLFELQDAKEYVGAYIQNQIELKEIENASSTAVPQWQNAVMLFNNRFVDMPFTLEVENLTAATLGKEPARLSFVFRDGDDVVKLGRSEVKTLSQGEKRAMYLLNFIFDTEERKGKNDETLFIIDDIADSFDYKNKHAIVQYLNDLCATDYFHQIILTHNFDFFRTLSDRFVNRKRLFMANKVPNGIKLEPADAVNNVFINKWKPNIQNSPIILCASIPFIRNLIEYQKGENDTGYRTLTSLLHWMVDTENLTVDNFWAIYNPFFITSHSNWATEKVVTLIFSSADTISNSTTHQSLCLEDKVLMSIAIRLLTEKFMIEQIRHLSNEHDYWPEGKNQFSVLKKKYSSLAPLASNITQTIERVSLTVSSNIHLNSFMYEPILDLTIEHLINLYVEVKALSERLP